MRFISLAFVLLTFSAVASADEVARKLYAEALVAMGSSHMDVTMMMYDEENTEYVDKAIDSTQLTVDLLAQLEADGLIPEEYLETFQWASEQWRLSLQEGGMLEIGYDPSFHGDMATGLYELTTMFEALHEENGPVPDEEMVYVLAQKTMARYVHIAAFIFGSLSISVTDEDNNIELLTVRVEDMLASLMKSADPSSQDYRSLRSAHSKWVFMKPVLLKPNETSTPTIVYRYAGDIAESLSSLQAEPTTVQ